MRSHRPRREIHASRFTSWSALTRRVDWRLAHDEDLVASGTSRLRSLWGATTSTRGRPSLEEAAGRHEREATRSETHDEPFDIDGSRVERRAHINGARSEVVEELYVTEETCKLFSAMTVKIVSSSKSFLEATRSCAVVFWSAMVAQCSEWPRIGLVASSVKSQ